MKKKSINEADVSRALQNNKEKKRKFHMPLIDGNVDKCTICGYQIAQHYNKEIFNPPTR